MPYVLKIIQVAVRVTAATIVELKRERIQKFPRAAPVHLRNGWRAQRFPLAIGCRIRGKQFACPSLAYTARPPKCCWATLTAITRACRASSGRVGDL